MLAQVNSISWILAAHFPITLDTGLELEDLLLTLPMTPHRQTLVSLLLMSARCDGPLEDTSTTALDFTEGSSSTMFMVMTRTACDRISGVFTGPQKQEPCGNHSIRLEFDCNVADAGRCGFFSYPGLASHGELELLSSASLRRAIHLHHWLHHTWRNSDDAVVGNSMELEMASLVS